LKKNGSQGCKDGIHSLGLSIHFHEGNGAAALAQAKDIHGARTKHAGQ
jgi:hypothetical protein